MTRKLIISLALTAASMTAAAESYPQAVMKAQYRYEFQTTTTSGEEKTMSDDFILQIAPGESRFYSIKTQFLDSIEATPGGKEIVRQMAMNALTKSGGLKTNADGSIKSITLNKDAMAGIPRRGQLFQVYKHFGTGDMTVYDVIVDDNFEYTVPMSDLVWEIGDSTKTVMNYECQQATADYHGRKWTAWFTPDIAVQEGPWQLAGLPGLIMEAGTEGGEYRFTITGLQETSEPIEPIPGNRDFIKTDRCKHRRNMKEYRDNPNKAMSAKTGMSLGLKASPNKHDDIETDCLR